MGSTGTLDCSRGNAAASEREHGVIDAIVALRHPLLLFCAALALIRAWEEVFFIGSVPPFPATEYDNNWLYFVSKSVAFLACAWGGKRLARRRVRIVSYGVVAGGAIVASACKLTMLWAPVSAAPVLAAGAAITGGASVAVAMLLWFGLCARVNATISILCYLCVRVLAPVAIVFVCSLPVPWPAVVGALFMPLAALAIGKATGCLPAAPARGAEEAAPSFWTVVVLVVVFDLAFGLREPLLGNAFFSSGSYTAFGSVLITLLMALSLLLARWWFNIGVVVRVVLPLAAVAFLLLPTNTAATRFVSDTCSAVAGTGVEALAILVLANHCYRYGASPARLYGILFGCAFAAIAAGRYAWPLLESLGFGESGLLACFDAVAVAAIAFMVILLPDRKAFEDWGFNVVGSVQTFSQADEAAAAEVRNRCHAFAREHGLTAREEEILLLIVNDKTNAEIQQELAVSKETVRSHRRNLYGKCNVHSRDELLEAIGPRR